MSHTDTQTSTGPCTEAGKAASSRNAVKHNLCSTRLTGADLEQLNAIRARLDSDWPPSTQTERMLLDQMALSQWRMERALSLELVAFDDTHIDQAMLALATPMPSEPSSTPKFARSKPAHRKMNVSFNAAPEPVRTPVWHIVCS